MNAKERLVHALYKGVHSSSRSSPVHSRLHLACHFPLSLSHQRTSFAFLLVPVPSLDFISVQYDPVSLPFATFEPYFCLVLLVSKTPSSTSYASSFQPCFTFAPDTFVLNSPCATRRPHRLPRGRRSNRRPFVVISSFVILSRLSFNLYLSFITRCLRRLTRTLLWLFFSSMPLLFLTSLLK